MYFIFVIVCVCCFKDLKIKLNKIHLLCKNSQYSSNMLDTVTDIERFLDTTYYVAKKVQSKPSIVCDNKFFDSIQECITVNVDVASTYMLGYTPQFPSDYVISSTIEVVNDGKLPFSFFKYLYVMI